MEVHVLVCHCYAVYSREIDDAITDGARSVDDIADATGAGAGCGGCHPALCRRLGGHAPNACGGDACLRAALSDSGRIPVAV
jgi:NAD(P)H-nitrite reductase large subunit